MKKEIVAIVVAVIILIIVIVPYSITTFCYPVKYEDYVEKYASEYGLDVATVYAVIKTESDFKINAVSGARAIGLMQLMPATAKDIATRLGETFEKENLYSVNTNIKYGCYYIRYLLDMFSGDYVLALASYNAGFSNVKSWLKDTKCSVDGKHLSYIPFSETRAYIKKIDFAKKIYQSKIN